MCIRDRKYIIHPALWALKNKLRSLRGLKPCLDMVRYQCGQDPRQGDLRIPADEPSPRK